MSKYLQIREMLRRIRRSQNQRLLVGLSSATLWGTLGFIGAGTILLGLAYSRTLHYSVVFSWAVGLAAFWAVRGLMPVLRWRRDMHTARLLERHIDDLGSDVTSSLEFGCALNGGDTAKTEQMGSPALMEAHVERTAELLRREQVAFMDRLPNHRTPQIRTVALGIAVTVGIILLVWPTAITDGFRRLFWGPDARPSAHVVEPEQVKELLVGSIRVSYRYPAYTDREPVSFDNLTGRVEVLAGTEVTLQATALEDAAAAVLIMRTPNGEEGEETSIELDIAMTGSTLEVTFTPLQDGTYTFGLIDGGGKRRIDPVDRSIRVIPDTVPQVELTTPDGIVSAAPGDVIPFGFAISDDYGLTEVSFVHAFAGDSEHERRDTLVTLDGLLVFQDTAGFDLASLALQPRDEVVVYVEAVDNDTIGGPKPGRSRPVLIRITSAEDRHLEIIAREQQLFEAFLAVLGDYLENPVARLELDENGIRFVVPDLRADEYHPIFSTVRAISNQVGEILVEMRDLIAAMEGDELMLRRDYELLDASYQELHGLFRDEQNVLNSMHVPVNRGRLTRYHMERIEGVRSQQVDATEQVIMLLEEVVAAQQMESMVRTLEELGAIQDRLRELLEQYRDTQDPELRAEIERELARLEARMRELLQRLAEQMQNLPEEHFNVEALEEMGMLGDVQDMTSALEQIRQMLELGDIDAALQALDDLESQVEMMLQQMNESTASGGGGISELDQHIAELMDRINDLEAQETEIEADTETLQEEIRERRTEEVQEELEHFIERARREVAEMQRILEEANQETLREHIQQTLSETQDRLESLDEQLGEQDIANALEQAQALRDELGEARREIARADSRRMSNEIREAHQQAGRSTQDVDARAQRLQTQLEDLIERARPVPGPQDQARLDELAEMQGETSQQLSELRQRVSEMGSAFGMIENELGPPLEQIDREMGEAQGRLGNGQVPGALENERQALQGLRRMRQQMHQMVARERMGQRSQGAMSRENVEIPEEPDETPAEFRRDILDAMREDSLEAYRDAIREYYEALVE